MVQQLMRKLFLPVAIVLLTCGCSGPTVSKVKGQVFYNNEPLSGADVEFKPESDLTLGSFIGQTDSEGRFEIRLGKGTGMNAKPGRFAVLITKGKLIGAPPPEEAASMNEEDRVKALMQAGPGGPGTSSGGSGILPAKYSNPSTTPFKVDISPGENDLNPFRMDGPALKKK